MNWLEDWLSEHGNNIHFILKWLHVGDKLIDIIVAKRVLGDIGICSRSLHEHRTDTLIGLCKSDNKFQHLVF